MPVKTFLTEVETLLKSGIATEHTYRSALQKLFDTVLSPATATNEPKHAIYGAPDFVIQQGSAPIGHVEAKDVGVDLTKIIADSEKDKPLTDNGRQLRRYRAALPNLLYTDGLEWHWFVGGEAPLDQPTRIATWDKGKKRLVARSTGTADLTKLLQQFATQRGQTVGTPVELARRLAQVARWLNDVIVEVFKNQGDQGELHQQIEAFRKTLLPTLKPDEFADMYAQTLVYGLFAARVSGPTKAVFTRTDAAYSIPKTNPFLRRLFNEIAGPDLDDRIAWLVEDCAHLLDRTDMSAVLHDFGKATRQEDPVVHFYETFLAAYDPKLRESRGIYYTPEPVVGYIVRSVDALLKTHFNKPMGVADDKTIILDPATGTATFLHMVVQQIHATLADQGFAGIWNSYVTQKLLPRLFGFELLMAPYTVAHLKMGLLLKQLGYTFNSNERLSIYLTNALADAPTGQQALAFAEYIAVEGQEANKVKHDKPVMVILGNPPYSGHSANQGAWINGLLRGRLPDGGKVCSYYEVDGQPLGERNTKWLQDDYVKFVRFAQWRINRTGEGILAFISNNGYLDNPTFRGMRQSLMEEFDAIFILNLHGNSKKRERTPDGGPDENVFDIQQGVAIGLFVKRADVQNAQGKIYYADLWGKRERKYTALFAEDVDITGWRQLSPTRPWYLFVPQDTDVRAEYEEFWRVPDVFPLTNMGMNTHRDGFVIDYDRQTLEQRIAQFISPTLSDDEIAQQFGLRSTGDFNLTAVRKQVRATPQWQDKIIECLYRPFDIRYLFFNELMIDRPRVDLNKHMLSDNLSLATTRQTREPFAVLATSHVCGQHKITATYDGSNIFPLYLYPDLNRPSLFDAHGTGPGGRRPNLSPDFITNVEQVLGLHFVPDGRGDLKATIGPEDIFHYAYAIFHSPTYRSRYAEFLKIDFPCLPLTSDGALFAALATKGAELVDLHLLRLPGDEGVGGNGGAKVLVDSGKQGVTFPKVGSGMVDKITYTIPHDSQIGRIAINNAQYFEGVEPETWEMRIGGYQPLDKWLKDRKGLTLTVDDVQHYLRMAIALRETRRIMVEIDALIPGWPIS